MSKNLSRRSLAIAAAIAMGVSTFSVMPAQAAEGDVTLTPTAGSNLGAFSYDGFQMTAGVTTAAGLKPETLAFEISTSQKDVEINLSTGVTGRTTEISTVVVRAYTATGTPIASGDVEASIADNVDIPDSAAASRGEGRLLGVTAGQPFTFKFDLDLHKAARVVISEITEGDPSKALTASAVRLKVEPLKDDGAAYTYGDGDPKDISVQAWIDLDSDVSDIEPTYASPVRTVSFYDPKSVAIIPSIERFVSKSGVLHNNDSKDTPDPTLAGQLKFAQSNLNLDQVDYSQWRVEATTDSTIRGFGEAHLDKVVTEEAGRKNHDAAGAIHFVLADGTDLGLDDDSDVDIASLSTNRNYGVEVTHVSGTSTDPKFNSVRFNPIANDTERETFVAVTDSVNASQTNTEPGTNEQAITLRPGTNSFTYEAQLYKDSPSDKNDVDETASVVVMAVVTAKYLAEDATLRVSGANEVLASKDQAAVVTGLTNSDGEFAVTVTSSDASALTSYSLEFYTLNGDEPSWENFNTAADGAATFTATYDATSGAPAKLSAANDTLAGASVTAEVSVEDTFGEATNTSGTKALYATFRASDNDDLDETVAVDADGKASITFDNYLDEGGSDLITASLHTGASYSDTNVLETTVLSIYNSADAAGVNVPAKYTGVITYGDFITGAASSSNIAPTDATRISTTPLTGTVVDANGSGVPGAVVTVDAPGMQLRKSGAGDYFQDSITFAADASGGFKVDMWSHTVNTDGVDVTITSGGQSATTEVKTYLPASLDGKNLVFTMDVPATPAVNQTYAIQASLTDKWGNPVATSGDTVRFLGVGSVTINSDTKEVDKSFRKDGTATVFLRSVKDIEGPGSVTAELLTGADYTTFTTKVKKDEALTIAEETTDVATTAHDETSFSNSLEVDVEVGGTPAQSADQKVNAGSFKGYVAVYAKGYEGQRLSAKIGNDWVIVDPIVNNEGANLHRTTDFTGAGVDIAVRIYIDRVLVDTINLTTK